MAHKGKVIIMIRKIQFVFCKHTHGHLACEDEIQAQPPLGIITLASYLDQTFQDIQVEAYDGKYFGEVELLQKLDGDVVGFSTWFSNYEFSISLAERIKCQRPNTTIIFGGPHATAIPNRILENNSFVDYVICGEGEVTLAKLLSGVPAKEISGLFFKDEDEIKGSNLSETIDLDLLPPIDLSLLHPQYQWLSTRESPAMSAFPLSGVRGCLRGHNRCEYCSIPIKGYRCISPAKYWEQVNHLNQEYGIDFFFETGDTFPLRYLRDLGAITEHADVKFRIYSYPSTLKSEDMPYLKAMGVRTIFMGVESVLHWSGKFKRRYPPSYSIESLIAEIEMCGQSGIDVIPGFLLGLPGEDENSLSQNLSLIQKISRLVNVNEITVSTVLPLPGSDYFNLCCEDSFILNEYKKYKGIELTYTDKIDYYFLSQLFVKHFTKVKYEQLYTAIKKLKEQLGKGMANWGTKKPILQF